MSRRATESQVQRSYERITSCKGLTKNLAPKKEKSKKRGLHGVPLLTQHRVPNKRPVRKDTIPKRNPREVGCVFGKVTVEGGAMGHMCDMTRHFVRRPFRFRRHRADVASPGLDGKGGMQVDAELP